MITFEFSVSAKKVFIKLELKRQERIINKLKSLKDHPNISQVLGTLTDFSPATHRLRIGSFRLILEQKSAKKFLILDLGHRRSIYK